jgi:hypothetical protein
MTFPLPGPRPGPPPGAFRPNPPVRQSPEPAQEIQEPGWDSRESDWDSREPGEESREIAQESREDASESREPGQESRENTRPAWQRQENARPTAGMSAADIQETGHPAVDAVLQSLANAARLAPGDQIAEYEAAHAVLQETLAGIDR